MFYVADCVLFYCFMWLDCVLFCYLMLLDCVIFAIYCCLTVFCFYFVAKTKRIPNETKQNTVKFCFAPLGIRLVFVLHFFLTIVVILFYVVLIVFYFVF